MFEKNFNYYDLRIYFPDRQTKRKEVYYSTRDPIRDFPIIDDSDGQITMQISGIIDEITTKIERKINCQTGDIIGICYEHEEAHIPYDYMLTFTIEE